MTILDVFIFDQLYDSTLDIVLVIILFWASVTELELIPVIFIVYELISYVITALGENVGVLEESIKNYDYMHEVV